MMDPQFLTPREPVATGAASSRTCAFCEYFRGNVEDALAVLVEIRLLKDEARARRRRQVA